MYTKCQKYIVAISNHRMRVSPVCSKQHRALQSTQFLVSLKMLLVGWLPNYVGREIWNAHAGEHLFTRDFPPVTNRPGNIVPQFIHKPHAQPFQRPVPRRKPKHQHSLRFHASRSRTTIFQ